MSDLSVVAPPAPDRVVALRQTARDVIRDWLGDPDDARVLAAVARMGQAAVAEAADQSRRLPDGPSPQIARADALLNDLRALVEGLAAPAPPARRWFPFGTTPAPSPAPAFDQVEPKLAALLTALDQQRDALIHDAVRMRSEQERVTRADVRLEDAVHLLDMVEAATSAAARETAATDPTRAALLRGPVAAALQERRRDVLTQLVVTRQGRLSLDILGEAQGTLVTAIDRARTTMAAALRTAVGAARALADARAMGEQARALEATAGAAASGREATAERALADAVAQMRAALDAAAGDVGGSTAVDRGR